MYSLIRDKCSKWKVVSSGAVVLKTTEVQPKPAEEMRCQHLLTTLIVANGIMITVDTSSGPFFHQNGPLL